MRSNTSDAHLIIYSLEYLMLNLSLFNYTEPLQFNKHLLQFTLILVTVLDGRNAKMSNTV